MSTPIVVRSLDINKDPFQPREDNEELLDTKVPYLSVIGALMCFANSARLDVSFFVNLLSIFSSFLIR